MFVDLQPSYEQLAAENSELRVLVEGLRAEIATLTVRLERTSKNPSMPPSSDGLAKPAPRSLRRKSGLKSGGSMVIRGRR